MSRIRQPVPATASTYCRVAVAIPHMRWSRFSATRSAVSSARACPSRLRQRRAGRGVATRRALPRASAGPGRAARTSAARREARDDAGGLGEETAARASAFRNGPLGRDVARTHVLGEQLPRACGRAPRPSGGSCGREDIRVAAGLRREDPEFRWASARPRAGGRSRTARASAGAASPPRPAAARAARSPAARRAGRGRASRAC